MKNKKNPLILGSTFLLSFILGGTLVGCNVGDNNSSSSNEPSLPSSSEVSSDVSSEEVSSEEISSEEPSSVEVSSSSSSQEEIVDLLIQFESNGGTRYYDVEYHGGTINLPEPEKADHIFLGWFDNEALEGEALGETLIPTDNMTLYASWERIDYPIVSFVTNTDKTIESIEYKGGTLEIDELDKYEYEFIGWFDNEACEGDPISLDEFVPTEDVTLYADWEEIDYPVITFETDSDNTKIDPIKYKGQTIDVDDPEKYGYLFLGWYDNQNFEGNPLKVDELTPTEDITLYAKYQECVYIHYYYGQYSDSYKEGYIAGTEVDYVDLFVPESLYIEGVECPFTGWTYEDGTVVGNSIVVDEEVILVATYDRSNAPMKHYLTEYDEGVLTSTGNVAYQHLEHEGVAYFEVKMMLTKGTSGGCGVAWRMDLSGNDYPYQDEGTTYLSAVIAPASGLLQVATVTNGAFAHMKDGSVNTPLALTKLPVSWQEKFNNNEQIFVTIGVEDGGDYFSIYIDGELAFTYDNATTLANYTGTGFGIRCSSKGTDFMNFKLTDIANVKFDSNGGSEVPNQTYVTGKFDLPYSTKSGVALEGWYYDEELTQKVDPNNFNNTGKEITLYAKWTEDYYNVTLDTNGGQSMEAIRYANGELIVADADYDNHIFLGWYYDKECTQLVDLENPVIEDDITIYAGWRLPYGYSTETSTKGVYEITGKSTIVHGVSDTEGYVVEMDINFTKGSTGAVGILFAGTVNNDYDLESGQYYLSAQIVPANGKLQVSKVANGFAHLTGSVAALETMPQAWQDKFNGASEGETVNVVLKVVASPDSFLVYLDDELVYVSKEGNLEAISSFTGRGYGVRTSVPANSCTYSIKLDNTDLVKVSFVNNTESFNRYTLAGDIIPYFTMTGTEETLSNGNVKTVMYNWKKDGEIITTETTYSEDTILAFETVEIVRRGKFIVGTDTNGTTYTALEADDVTDGIMFPDATLKQGTFSYDMTFDKPSANMNTRIFFYGYSSSVSQSGAKGQGALWININLRTGTTILGIKTEGVTCNAATFVGAPVMVNLAKEDSSTAVSNLLSTDTTSSNYKNVGDRITINFKVDINANGGIKFYLNNFLIGTYGSVDITGDTYSSTYLTQITADDLKTSDSVTIGGTTKTYKDYFLDYQASPAGYGVGYTTWTAPSASGCGEIVISNVVVNDTSSNS